MGLQGFEKRLERLVEGAFSRAFRSQLRPVEVGRRLAREMDLAATVGVRGERIAPNDFVVHLAFDDHARFEPLLDTLPSELADAVDEHARDSGYTLKGPTVVALAVDATFGTGQFHVDAAIRPGPRATAPTMWLVTPTGARVAVTDGDPVTIGRLPECDIELNDAKVSRRHAEVRVGERGPVVVDLSSLNGTKVNGRGVPKPTGTDGQLLHDGDIIQIGNAHLRFELSSGSR